MISGHLKHFSSVLNIWLACVFLLILSSNLPHEQIPVFSWINVSAYLLIFIQSCFIIRHTHTHRLLYVLIALFGLSHFLNLVNVFIGDEYSFGNIYLSFYYFEYRTIFTSFFAALCVIYICLRYYFEDYDDFTTLGLTLAVIIPVFFAEYYPFLTDKGYIFDVEDSVLFSRVMYFDLLPLMFLLFYGFLVYKYDRTLGEHINTLMVSFFIITLMDVTNYFTEVYRIITFSVSQYVLAINLSLFIITLFRVLSYVSSPVGQFYETIAVSDRLNDIRIKRKQGTVDIILRIVKTHFHLRRNLIGALSVLAIFLVNFFDVSLFIKINLSVITVSIIVLSFYVNALNKKRLKQGNFIKIQKSRN